MSLSTIRVALPAEYELLSVQYRRWGYRGDIAPSDVAYVAEHDAQPIGIVRRTIEHGVTMLRGMQIDPAYRRQGVGSRLLDAFVADARDQHAFCIPFSHLTGFYGRGGFRILREDRAPQFLVERLARYRREGHHVLVMHRPEDTQPDHAD